MKVNIIIIFICLIETLICDIILDKELDPYYVSYETAMHEVKMVSCLNLIEHALKQDGGIKDLKQVIQEAGAHAAAGGSMFVFYGRLRAVLITAPTEQELTEAGVYHE